MRVFEKVERKTYPLDLAHTNQCIKASAFSIPLEAEYQISKNFFQNISNHLQHKQMQLMSKSNEFIEKYTSIKSSQDLCFTKSHLSSSHTFRADSETMERRLINRKSPKALPIESDIQRCLSDVDANCSQKTGITIRNAIEDMKRMKKLIISLQSAQKASSHSENKVERLYQQNLMLHLKIKELKSKVASLAEKSSAIQEDRGDRNLQVIQQMRKLRSFVIEKEKNINEKMKQVHEIENGIEMVFRQEEDQCDKCCTFLKRIQGSLLQYRQCLKHQESELDRLYSNYKALIFNP